MFTKNTKKLLLLIAIFSALAAGALMPLRVQAAVFNVTKTADTNDGVCNADCSLREAIVAANALITGPHTINVPAGTYTLTIVGAGEEDAATGDLDINENITITGASAATTIINGGGIDRVFDIDPYDISPTVTLQNLTITGGSVSGPGGGAYVNSSGCPIVTLTNIAITGNTAGLGGGVANDGCGSLTIISSTINGNTAVSGDGGGINSAYALTLTNVTVSGNATINGDGAGIYTNSFGNTTTITNSTISGNIAGTGGGGIFAGNGTMTVTGSTISGNIAGTGGGVSFAPPSILPVAGANLQVVNSTISGNTASGSGGGFFNGNYGSLTPLLLSYSTVANNNAATGGGIYGDFILDFQNNTFLSNTAFGNTIVANNPTGGNCAGAGIRTSNGNNLDSANTCGFASSGDLINIDPLLSALANNGGSTFTHALLTGSPAINAGNNTGCPATDQRGYSRSGNCDIGAYEFGGIAPFADLSITKTGSPDPVTVGNNLTYTITITNNGPNTATGVTLTDTLPGSVTFVSSTPSQGFCSGAAVVTCSIGSLANSASATVAIVVTPTAAGTLTSTASVTAAETDTNAANNSATQGTTVSAAGGNTSAAASGGGDSGETGGGGCGSGSSGSSNCSGDNSSSVCSQMSNKRKNNQQPFSGALMLFAPLTWLLFRRAVRKMLNAHALQVSRP